MTLAPHWNLRMAGYDASRERRLAEASRGVERAALDRDSRADETRFVAYGDALARLPHVVLGTTATGAPYRISLDDLTSLPSWTTAGTGAGKSRMVGALMQQVVAAIAGGAPLALLEIEGKGEGADMLLRTIASEAERLPARERETFFGRVNTFRFFDRDVLPSWPLLSPVPGVSILAQAEAFAEILMEVGADTTVGPRQRSTLAAFSAACIESRVPAVAWPWILSTPREVAALGARSAIPSVRLGLARFEREPQGSIDGLIARIETLLRVPSLRAVISGQQTFEFMSCFEPGAITVLDFGRADLGARAAVRALGSLAISAAIGSAFDPRRHVRGTTMIVVDEPQTLMTSVTLGQFERAVSLGRSFGAGGLALVHQGATQLPLELQTILNTNVPLRILGRSSAADANAASEWLPRTGRVPRSRVPGSAAGAKGFLTTGEELRFRVEELGRLPPRHFLVSDRRASFAPRVVRSPEYAPPPWSAIDPAIAERVRRGSVGAPRRELEERVRQIEEQAAARLAEHLATEESSGGRRRGAPPSTPDVVSQPRGQRSRGGVP